MGVASLYKNKKKVVVAAIHSYLVKGAIAIDFQRWDEEGSFFGEIGEASPNRGVWQHTPIRVAEGQRRSRISPAFFFFFSTFSQSGTASAASPVYLPNSSTPYNSGCF